MNPKYISIIHKQLTTFLKVKYLSILFGYYKSHVVGNRKLIWVAIIKIYWLIFIQIKLFYNNNKHFIDIQYYVQC